MEVRFDMENCIGCGACTNICPKYWEIEEDGKCSLKGATEIKGMSGWVGRDFDDKDEQYNKKAQDICPVNVIHLITKVESKA